MTWPEVGGVALEVLPSPRALVTWRGVSGAGFEVLPNPRDLAWGWRGRIGSSAEAASHGVGYGGQDFEALLSPQALAWGRWGGTSEPLESLEPASELRASVAFVDLWDFGQHAF